MNHHDFMSIIETEIPELLERYRNCISDFNLKPRDEKAKQNVIESINNLIEAYNKAKSAIDLRNS